jgi:hypothetical protein
VLGGNVTIDQALAFLAGHQPMPSDERVTAAEADAYMAAIALFQASPDPRCVPLFIGSLSPDTGLGMYDHVKFVLMAHDKAFVAPHVAAGLSSPNDRIREECCWWAAELGLQELYPAIALLTVDPVEAVRNAAAAALETRRSHSAGPGLPPN